MSKTSNKKQFKNSTAYKIIVGVLLVLYIGFQIWGGGSDEAQDVVSNSTEHSEEQYAENVAVEAEVETSEAEESSLEAESDEASMEETVVAVVYTFRNDNLWESHYDKHGIDMGFADKEEYLQAANAVIVNPDTLHKIEGEDGDNVYYLEETNEFVVVSTYGYLRTYFLPDDGIDYYNRQ